MDTRVDNYVPKLVEAVNEIVDSFELMNIEKADHYVGSLNGLEPLVVSTIGLVGDNEGVIIAFFPESCAVHFTNRLFQSDLTEVDDEVRDAAGELSNMIVGAFKKRITDGKEPFKQSIPAVVSGQNISINQTDTDNNKIVEFSGLENSFYLQLSLTSE